MLLDILYFRYVKHLKNSNKNKVLEPIIITEVVTLNNELSDSNLTGAILKGGISKMKTLNVVLKLNEIICHDGSGSST